MFNYLDAKCNPRFQIYLENLEALSNISPKKKQINKKNGSLYSSPIRKLSQVMD